MDWKSVLLIENILIYWIYSYYLLYKYKLSFKCYLPKINVLFNILCNQLLGGFVFLYFKIHVETINIYAINIISIIYIIIDISILYLFQYLYYTLMCKIFNIQESQSRLLDNYIDKNNNIKYPYTTINCHILQHIFVNMISVFIGTNFWYCSNNSIIIWVWLITFFSIRRHANLNNLTNINDDIQSKSTKIFGNNKINKSNKNKSNKGGKKINNILLLEDLSQNLTNID